MVLLTSVQLGGGCRVGGAWHRSAEGRERAEPAQVWHLLRTRVESQPRTPRAGGRDVVCGRGSGMQTREGKNAVLRTLDKA